MILWKGKFWLQKANFGWILAKICLFTEHFFPYQKSQNLPFDRKLLCFNMCAYRASCSDFIGQSHTLDPTMGTPCTEFLNFPHSISRSRRVHLIVWHQPSPPLFSGRILQCLILTFGKSLPESNTRNTAKDEFKYMSVSDYSSKGKCSFFLLLL